MFAKKENFEYRKEGTPVKYINAGPSAIFIVTKNSYFMTGLTELVLKYYFSSANCLCILDSKSFDNAFKLLEFLKSVDHLNSKIEVLITNETLANFSNVKIDCPWVLGLDVNVESYIKTLMDISTINGSLKSILRFYSMNLRKRKLSNTQSTIIDYLVKGFSVNEIAQIMNASSKTIYSSIRQVCITHNQRKLIQLVHLFSTHKTFTNECKESLNLTHSV